MDDATNDVVLAFLYSAATRLWRSEPPDIDFDLWCTVSAFMTQYEEVAL